MAAADGLGPVVQVRAIDPIELGVDMDRYQEICSDEMDSYEQMQLRRAESARLSQGQGSGDSQQQSSGPEPESEHEKTLIHPIEDAYESDMIIKMINSVHDMIIKPYPADSKQCKTLSTPKKSPIRQSKTLICPQMGRLLSLIHI